MFKLRPRAEEGQASVEYGGVLILVAAVVAALLVVGVPAQIASAVGCSAEKVFDPGHSCAAAPAGRPAPAPAPATAMSISHPCTVPYVCRAPRRPSAPPPPPPSPPSRYGAWFYIGVPNSGGEYDPPCPPGYDFHADLQTGQDYCAWQPYDPSPTAYDENPGYIGKGRGEYPPTNVPGQQSNVADTEGQVDLVDQGTPYAHLQYFPGGLAQYDDFQKVVQELSRAGDIASKSGKDREALEAQIEAIAYGRSLEDVPEPGDTADAGEWEDPTVDG